MTRNTVLRFHRNLIYALATLFLFIIIYYTKGFVVVADASSEAERIVYFVFDVVGSLIISTVQSFI